MFQSHNGAIAAIPIFVNKPTTSVFQSHNGAIAAKQRKSVRAAKGKVSIPQWCDCCLCHREHKSRLEQCFNPTMVRLLRRRALRSRDARVVGFNPTMVRLLRQAGRKSQPNCVWFQSHNGAIAALTEGETEGWLGKVSIPQWCDCCPDTSQRGSSRTRFQSHNGAIAAFNDLSGSRRCRQFQSHNGAIAA